MKYFDIPALQGIDFDRPARLIAQNKVQDSKNIVYENGHIKSRPGYLAFGANLPLGNKGNADANTALPIMALTYYQLLRSQVKQIVAFTTRDSYYYEQTSGYWKYITRCYNTGTVTIDPGALTSVVGSGTTWDNTTWTGDDIYQIKFGDTDMNSAGTWYTVKSVDSSAGITLSTPYASSAGITSSAAYTLRLCWSGGEDDFHSIAYPYFNQITKTEGGSPADFGDKALVVSNGVDKPQVWTGVKTEPFVLLDSPTGAETYPAKFVGYYGSTGYEHTLLANTTEPDGGGGLTYNVNTIYVGYAADPEGGFETYYDLLSDTELGQNSGAILGIIPLGGKLIVYKEHATTEIYPNPSGGNTDPFTINENRWNDFGIPSFRSVQSHGNAHMLLGWDDVYYFDGINFKSMGDGVKTHLIKEMTKKYANRSFTFHDDAKGLIAFNAVCDNGTYPNETYVYNFIEGHWTKWVFTDQMYSWTVAKQEYSPAWNNSTFASLAWSSESARWADFLIEDDYNSIILGSVVGNIYKLSDDFADDNGTKFQCYFETADLAFGDPKHAKKILEMTLGFITGTGNVRVKCSVDFGTNWSDWIYIPLNTTGSTYVEYLVNFIERGKQVRFYIENYDGAAYVVPFELEKMLIGYNDQGIVNSQ